jgi:hypothetical protein
MSTITCSAAFGVPVPIHKVTEGKVIVIENFKTYKNTKFPQKFILRSMGGSETPVFEMNIELPPSKKGKTYMKHNLNISFDTSNSPLELIPVPANEEEEQTNPTMFFKLNYSLVNKAELSN